jgi:DNA-directed RNA polymerase specialized sigma24 family protein
MELTNQITELGYKLAKQYLYKMGRRDIDFQDLAHEAFIRLARTKPVPEQFIWQKVLWTIKSVFRDLYTNTTHRKHDVMLGAWHSPIDPYVLHENTTDAADEFWCAFKRLYAIKPQYAQLLADMRTLQEIAEERKVSKQAINQQQIRARQMLEELLETAA